MADRSSSHSSHNSTVVDSHTQSHAESGNPPTEKPFQGEKSKSHPIHIEDGTESALLEHHAYLWKKDSQGNLFLKSSPGDPTDPRYWPNWKRYGVVGLASLLNNLVCICVSGYSTGVGQMQEEFGFSAEVGTVGLSLYIVSSAEEIRLDIW